MMSAVETWSKAKLGLPTEAGAPAVRLRQRSLALARARQIYGQSAFYRNLCGNHPPVSLEDLPLTGPAHLHSMWGAPGRDIARIVTLSTSGTIGAPKRIAFTQADIERTLEFFTVGIGQVLSRGGRALTLLPGAAPHGVSDLVARACQTLGARCDVGSPAPAATYDLVVAMPQQALRLALMSCPPRWALLSADYVPRSIVARLNTMGVSVLEHYGMTETCFGGAVTCPVGDATQHIRDADLYFEVIDPATGAPLPTNTPGELVITSLTGCGTPLLRYRTGDDASLVDTPCACGGTSCRLGRVLGRIDGNVRLGQAKLSMPLLDELLFALPIADYAARVHDGGLHLTLEGPPQDERPLLTALYAQAGGEFPVHLAYGPVPPRPGKRKILLETESQ